MSANQFRMDSSGLLLREYLRNVEAAESNKRDREIAMLAMMIGVHNAGEDTRLMSNNEETRCEE